MIDTNQPDLEEETIFPFSQEYDVTARSLLLFELGQAEA